MEPKCYKCNNTNRTMYCGTCEDYSNFVPSSAYNNVNVNLILIGVTVVFTILCAVLEFVKKENK